MKARLEPLVPTWILIPVCAVSFAFQFAPLTWRSSAPNVSTEFWIIESDSQTGALLATENVSEDDPRIRAWCYAMGYRSAGRPFPIGLSLYRTGSLYIKIEPYEDGTYASSLWLSDDDYAAFAHTAWDLVETMTQFRGYMSPSRGTNLVSSSSWSVYPAGLVSSIVFDLSAALLIIRWIAAQISGRRERARRERINAGMCAWCGYEVRDLVSDECPECGHRVPPLDPAPSA